MFGLFTLGHALTLSLRWQTQFVLRMLCSFGFGIDWAQSEVGTCRFPDWGAVWSRARRKRLSGLRDMHRALGNEADQLPDGIDFPPGNYGKVLFSILIQLRFLPLRVRPTKRCLTVFYQHAKEKMFFISCVCFGGGSVMWWYMILFVWWILYDTFCMKLFEWYFLYETFWMIFFVWYFCVILLHDPLLFVSSANLVF